MYKGHNHALLMLFCIAELLFPCWDSLPTDFILINKNIIMGNPVTTGADAPTQKPFNNPPAPPQPVKLKGIFWFLEDMDTGDGKTFTKAENMFDLEKSTPRILRLKITCRVFDDAGMKKLTLTAQSSYTKIPGILFTDETSPTAISFDGKDQHQLSIEKTFLNFLFTAPFEEVFITFTARYTDQKGKVQTSKLKIHTTADAPH